MSGWQERPYYPHVLNVRVPTDIHARIVEVAVREGFSLSDTVRLLLARGLRVSTWQKEDS